MTTATKNYYPTIGLEVHAELTTASKMFSGSPNDPFAGKANANINSIDMAHPGTLPTINKAAVKHMIRIGLATGGEIANYTEFDRKHYFYPDIPKGYQISQFKYPIVAGGQINGVDITRIHLEEDTGTNKHDANYSLVDYNRAGVPLMELVTEPVIHSAKEAGDFGREFQRILRTLGASHANMEKGEMRVEVNISISPVEGELGTKVEVKNINSFKAVEKSIEFEIKRMSKLLDEDRGDEIVQETRGWDENRQKTISQRKKESADDYRYFPEPDLPKLMLHELFNLDEVKSELPELPASVRARYEAFNLGADQVDVLIDTPELALLFEEVLVMFDNNTEKAKLSANYITSDIVALQKEGGSLPSAGNFAKLISLVAGGDLSSRGAKDTLAVMTESDGNPEEIAKEKGLLQQSDEGAIKGIAQQVISSNQEVAEEFKSGKESSLQFLIGQGMKISKGSANPGVLKKVLEELLK